VRPPVRLESDWSELKIQFRIPPSAPALNFQPRWNGAPTQDFPVTRRNSETGARALY
jgi:hypothetical protein